MNNKIKLTNLQKDTYFIYNEKQYKKVDNYNISNKCIDLDTDEEVNIALMLLVEVIDKPKKKRIKRHGKNDSQEIDSDGLRDGWVGSNNVQSSAVSIDCGGPETTGNCSEFGI